MSISTERFKEIHALLASAEQMSIEELGYYQLSFADDFCSRAEASCMDYEMTAEKMTTTYEPMLQDLAKLTPPALMKAIEFYYTKLFADVVSRNQ
jgi:hypothetical protein